MLTDADNAMLTAVGAGTVMGNLMRQYWLPAIRSDELPIRQRGALRVMLLGEKLIAFRNDQGQVGLVAERCPHRGASLFFGRNEGDGLRCAYHGWKFDVLGRCVEMPLESDSCVRLRVRTRAYPCLERGGIVWTYMGQRSEPPLLPELIANMPSSGEARLDLVLIDCNWLQTLEGDLDVDHIPILHGANLEGFKAGFRASDSEELHPARASAETPRRVQRMPLEVNDGEVGCTFASHINHSPIAGKGASRPTLPQLWAIGQFMFPFYSMLPYGAYGAHWVAARVPMDDHHTMTFGMFSSTSPQPSRDLMFGAAPAFQADSGGWFTRFRPTRVLENDFGFQRDTQGHGAFAAGVGISGQAIQDACIAQSMGPVADRSAEHLGAGDAVIVRLRRRLAKAARELSESGTTPPGVDNPQGYRLKQGILRVRPGMSWVEEIQARQAVADG